MTLSPEAAYIEIAGVIKNAWSSLGYAEDSLVWPLISAEIPKVEAVWARCYINHVEGTQASLQATRNGDVLRDLTGFVNVQVFCPLASKTGNLAALRCAAALLEAFQKDRQNVRYRRPRFKEVGADGSFAQVNVMVDFTYS